jgi:N-acetylglutamate synthase-like GNAT family acetyltransferase
MEELVIRDTIPSDLPGLQELYLHLNPDDQPSAREEAVAIFERFRLYSGSTILIGTVQGKPITSCTLVIVPNLTRSGQSYALIENVVTHIDWRKRGFGSAILAEAAKRAWDHDCYKVMLLTGSKDPATLTFYANAGFEQSKTGFQMRRRPVRDGS